MGHELVRATLVPVIVKCIADKHGVSEDTALNMFYKSSIAESYCDDETGLYGQSALYIFSLFEEEISGNILPEFSSVSSA